MLSKDTEMVCMSVVNVSISFTEQDPFFYTCRLFRLPPFELYEKPIQPLVQACF